MSGKAEKGAPNTHTLDWFKYKHIHYSRQASCCSNRTCWAFVVGQYLHVMGSIYDSLEGMHPSVAVSTWAQAVSDLLSIMSDQLGLDGYKIGTFSFDEFGTD
jgi:hypothetical protein